MKFVAGNNPKTISILLIVFTFAIGYLFKTFLDDKSYIANAILATTAMVLLYYTFETYRLRVEAQKAAEGKLRPFLRLRWRDRKSMGYNTLVNGNFCDIEIVNDGEGVAMDIKFINVKLEGFEFIKIKGVDVVSPRGGSAFLQLAEHLAHTKAIGKAFTHNNPSLLDALNGLEIEILYQDIEFGWYRAQFVVDSEMNDHFSTRNQYKDVIFKPCPIV
ncbi:hypothetical protein K8R04_02125 [Candidatus Uhrbacteria bacterium]|nr:hypothetical protein [Candidatus Uhrbacteria bacterium]